MEEIQALHNINLEWGCITNLLDKISNIEDTIEGGWPELIDMLADAMSEEGAKKDPVSVFFNLYAFMFRLYYRLKVNPKKREFNQYSNQEDEFWVTNYSYSVFVWAMKHGFTKGIDNLVIKIPKSSLTDKERRAIERRCK